MRLTTKSACCSNRMSETPEEMNSPQSPAPMTIDRAITDHAPRSPKTPPSRTEEVPVKVLGCFRLNDWVKENEVKNLFERHGKVEKVSHMEAPNVES